MKIPATFAELNQAADLPFSEGNTLISQAGKSLVENWGRSLYPNFGAGYLHSSDHYAALNVILEREPTFREVYDSLHAGSRNIDLARKKMSGDLRPSGWDTMSAEARRYAVLVHLHGISKGSKIFDGRAKDPKPTATAELLAEWSGGAVPTPPVEPPAPPPEPPAPPTPPTPPVPAPSAVSALLAALEGRLTARLDQILSRLPRN
jgi:hypothetical protein